MHVALVHDYLKEYGGAERVLKVLTEMYPDAPIYTAFSVKGSTAEKQFKGSVIHESWLAPLLTIGNLYSPLRFLIPWIWGSFNLSDYDLVITSASWYVTRGFKVGNKTRVVCYCHTPPRWLYGYETSVNFQKYWPVKIYAAIVGHFLRMYDYKSAQKIERNSKFKTQSSKLKGGVDYFIANSENVKARIEKFYRRDSVVIYPPVDVEKIIAETKKLRNPSTGSGQAEKYFLIVSRLVGAKGIENAIKVFQSKSMSKYKLKIVGEAHGYSNVEYRIKNMEYRNIEFMGRVDDERLWEFYAKARGFIALARDEDFGMTVVEAQAAGCPVIVYNGGGFKETVVNGVTGLLINDTNEKTLIDAVEKLIKIKWNKKKVQENAMKFRKDEFIRKMREEITKVTK
jgi:glycosyltransferase involved in cell wall biosynthesis